MILRRLRPLFSRLPAILNLSPTAITIRQWTVQPTSSVFGAQQHRSFGKSADRSDRRGEKKHLGNLNDDSLGDLLEVEEVRAEMKHEIEILREDFVQQLSVRANLQAFERLVVKLPDNSEVPLNHLAQVTMKTPQMVIINLTASPHAVRSVADALVQSGLSTNPQIQTTTIYVPVAKPSREYREKLVQTAKLLYNRCHDRLRAVDKRFQLHLRQFERTASKDSLKNAQSVLHELVKQYAAQAEEMMKAKQKELMEEIK